MAFGLILVTPPVAYPLSLAEAKAHLRVEGDEENDLITALIAAATGLAETVTRRALVTQTWDFTLDAFPCGPIRLPLAPTQSVTSVKYIDASGVQQTWGAGSWRVDLAEPARITPVFGEVWPVAREQTAAISVRFVAGYGAAAAVDPAIVQGIKLLVGHWYENRETVNIGIISSELPFATTTLWNSRRAWGL